MLPSSSPYKVHFFGDWFSGARVLKCPTECSHVSRDREIAVVLFPSINPVINLRSLISEAVEPKRAGKLNLEGKQRGWTMEFYLWPLPKLFCLIQEECYS